MSDMYLVLRRRLDDVARQHDWVPIGTETMRDARKHLGLSYEAVGRALSVASKTYERWEKAGEGGADHTSRNARGDSGPNGRGAREPARHVEGPRLEHGGS
jgi:DNA-binding XRE family transcriptional regulator